MQSVTSTAEIRDVAPGLWIWRMKHPGWKEDDDWPRVVTSTFVESRGERVVLDPLAPPSDATEVWKKLDDHPPTAAVVLMPDHVRDIDVFARRYQLRAFGPMFFFPDDAPKAKLEPILADFVLPGGLVALYDGRGRLETPIWLPEQKVIVFGDALTEREGELRVWDCRAGHEKRELPALRAMLELPFEKVIVSHGEPVHDRKAFEKALELKPFR